MRRCENIARSAVYEAAFKVGDAQSKVREVLMNIEEATEVMKRQRPFDIVIKGVVITQVDMNYFGGARLTLKNHGLSVTTCVS